MFCEIRSIEQVKYDSTFYLFSTFFNGAAVIYLSSKFVLLLIKVFKSKFNQKRVRERSQRKRFEEPRFQSECDFLTFILYVYDDK